MDMTTDLFFIRHGETEWNRAGRMQGHGDSPLTPLGRSQIQAIGRRLQVHQPEVLACSDLGRARQSAELLARMLQLEPEIWPDLRERNLGIFEGLTLTEIENQHPGEFTRWRSNDADHVIPDGESLRQRTVRLIHCLDRLVATHSGRRVAAVTHGGLLDGMIRHVLDMPLDTPRRHWLANAAFNHFRHEQGRWSLVTWGDTSHLSTEISAHPPSATH
jgi:probable phosphoglycerate mutase